MRAAIQPMIEVPGVALFGNRFSASRCPLGKRIENISRKRKPWLRMLFSDVEVLDTALMEKYRSLAQATIAKYGGHYVVRGGVIEPVEGDWVPKHLVIVEFPAMEQAREWYHSTE